MRTSNLLTRWAPTLLLVAGLFTVSSFPARADSLTNLSSGGGSVWDAATGHYAAQSGLDSNCAFASNASACGWAGVDSIVEVSSQQHDLFPDALASEAFQINGPVFNQAVPMIITGSWTWSEPAAEDSSPPAGFGSVWVELFNNDCCDQELFTLTSNNAHDGFFSTHFTWYAGFTSIILTTVGCGVSSSGAGAEENPNCSVDIDPAITIDPDFLTNNPGYSLAEGMPPAPPSPTPEPSTWALLLTGALLLAAIHLYDAHTKRETWKGISS